MLTLPYVSRSIWYVLRSTRFNLALLFSVVDEPTSQDSSYKSHLQKTNHKTQVIESAVALQAGGTCNVVPPAEHLVVLFSEKGRCHFCRLLCPDVQVNYD